MTIKERRIQLGLSQEQLAEKAGVTQQYISHVETGKIKKANKKMLDALGLELNIELSIKCTPTTTK